MLKLDPSIKTIWAISGIFRTIFWTAIFLVAEFVFIRPNLNSWNFPPFTLSASIFVLSATWAGVFPWLNYKYWSFEVREDELYLVRGILTRVKTTAPFSRIQHLDVEQSVMDRFFHLGKLAVYTAGTRGADLVIPGLPIEYAEDLRDHLKNITHDDAV